MLGQITEEGAAALGGIFSVAYFAGMVFLARRLDVLYATGRLGERHPRLFNSLPHANIRALVFVYSRPAGQIRDTFSHICFWVVRVAFPAAIFCFLFAMFRR